MIITLVISSPIENNDVSKGKGKGLAGSYLRQVLAVNNPEIVSMNITEVSATHYYRDLKDNKAA
jgi:hypothetical protein